MDYKRASEILPDFKNWLIVRHDCTSETAQKHLYSFIRYFRFQKELDEDSFVNYIAFVRGNREASTIEKYIQTFRLFLDFLIFKGIINYNWARSIPMPKRDKKLPTILSIKEIEKLIDTKVSRSYIHYEDQGEGKKVFDTILLLCAKCGCRIGEALQITPQQIDFEQGTWNLDHTKTRRGRIVPIPKDILPTIASYAKIRNPDDRIFVHPLTNQPVRIHQVERNFRLRLRDAGINKKATVHTLRHSFITELMKLNTSIFTVMAIVGHENPKTTMEYNKLLFESLVEGINRHPLNAMKRNPYEILKDVKETIERFQLKNDSRFMFNVEEGNEGLRVSIFVR